MLGDFSTLVSHTGVIGVGRKAPSADKNKYQTGAFMRVVTPGSFSVYNFSGG